MSNPAALAGSAAYQPSEAKRARTIVTPEGIAVPMIVASRSARIGALFLDMIILILTLFLVSLLLDAIMGGLSQVWEEEVFAENSAVREFVYVVGTIFAFFFWYGYFLVQELSPRGATFGKRILGIRVAARNGRRLTPDGVIARNLLRDIEITFPIVYFLVTLVMSIAGESGGSLLWAATFWFLLFALFPFFNKDALRAGDVIAGTWVVDAPRTQLADAMSTQGAASTQGSSALTGERYQFGEAELSVYGEKELQTLERLLREDNENALYAVHSTICRKIGWDPGQGDERAFLEAFYSQLRARLENDMRFGKRKADKHS